MSVLKNMHLENFTVFEKASFSFGKNLNVVIGQNGMGKSHLLKLGYSYLSVCADQNRRNTSMAPTKQILQKELSKKMQGVFRPDYTGRLVRRRPGRGRCDVKLGFSDASTDCSFNFSSNSKTEVNIDVLPEKWSRETPVFLPTRELLTLYPGFVSLYETAHIPFEETYRDTCILLGAPLAKGPREHQIRQLLQPLEDALGGSVSLESSGFYLHTEDGKMEINLVAEGLRKLAMLARLIATGELLAQGFLFWDEPEANLNPAIIKKLAPVIFSLARSGIQVFIATHSLFLLRELQLLQNGADFHGLDIRYIGLKQNEAEGAVSAECKKNFEDLSFIASLEEELAQAQKIFEQV